MIRKASSCEPGNRGGTTVSGFPEYSRDERIHTLVQVLEGGPPANTPPVVIESIPGTQPRYSGGGFTIVQMVLQDVLGTPFPQIMDRLVLQPTGMYRSTFEQPLHARLRGDGTRQPWRSHTREMACVSRDGSCWSLDHVNGLGSAHYCSSKCSGWPGHKAHHPRIGPRNVA